MTELVPYKAPPPPIAKANLKKEELNLRERLWVWNDIIVLAIGAVLLALGIGWLAIPLTMHFIGISLASSGCLLLGAGITTFCIRWFGDDDAINSGAKLGKGPTKALTHKARADLCLFDRNRRARPHRDSYRYADRRYSVWPTYGDYGKGKQVTLIMLEHIRPDPYPLVYLLPKGLRFSHRCWWVRVPSGDASIQGLKGMSREQIEIEFEKMEAAAEFLEKAPHIEKVRDYKQEEIALDLRRTAPSTMKTKVIKVARKQLNK